MNRVVNFLQKYFAVISVLIGISILLSISFSSFIVTSNNHKAAEMYIGELKYSIELNGSSTNTLTVPTGATIVNVKVNNLNPVDTYYKLLYLKNTNITVKYYESTKDTDDVVTTYNKPNDSVASSNSNTIKLLITNNSTVEQNIVLTMKGGYITNTIQDITTPSTYSEITLVETPSSNTYFCKTNDTLTQGLKYVNGQYTYAYKQEGNYTTSYDLVWQNNSNNGWGVQLTNKSSTDAVTSKLCTYISNKPTISLAYLYLNSQATSIDLSGFDTSNVVNMKNMFSRSQATTLDVSSFNTSNITDMSGMFVGSKATSLDLSNFDTSNVTDMSSMFEGSQAITLGLSSFDTSKVTNMSNMFASTKATILDLSSFDTSKVTDMCFMFYYSLFTTLDLSSFDTSKVTDMEQMFNNSQATILDLSSFDTSKVTNMGAMFYYSTKLKTIYISDKFNTDKVTSSTNMFYNCPNLVGGSGTTYSSSRVNKTYARIDGGTSNPGYFTDIADKVEEPESFATDSWPTIINAVKNNNISKYSVGDTKEIDMGSYGTHTLRIANTTTPSECSTTGFSQTACGFVLEFEDIITTKAMNSTNTNVGGWPASSMYTFVNNDIYNALPSDLRNGIIDTVTVSGHGRSDSSSFTLIDKLYLLAPGEVWSDWKTSSGAAASYDTAKDLTRTLDYYTAQGVTTSNYSGAIKKNESTASLWWLRTAFSLGKSGFYSAGTGGRQVDNSASRTCGVSPAFRIG